METSRDRQLERLRKSASHWLGEGDESRVLGAMIETAFLMAVADGDLGDSEFDQLVATIQYITSEQLSSDAIRAMIDQLAESLKSDGWAERIAEVANGLPDAVARRNAFRLAAGVSFIDGEVQEHEAQLFGMLATAFEIPTEEATSILDEVRDELFSTPTIPPEEPKS